MSNIELPFSREMAIAAIEGRKIATTRSERKGEIGDRFTIPDYNVTAEYVPARGWFRLIDIWEVRLENVKRYYFRLEGFDSPAAFEKTWRALHRGHFTLSKVYYIHFFARVV